MYRIEIELDPEEIQGLEETVKDVQKTQGCSEAEAVKQLLGIGLNSYVEQRRWQEFRARQKPFNPFAAARGEA
jgi:hypothetical protein